MLEDIVNYHLTVSSSSAWVLSCHLLKLMKYTLTTYSCHSIFSAQIRYFRVWLHFLRINWYMLIFFRKTMLLYSNWIHDIKIYVLYFLVAATYKIMWLLEWMLLAFQVIICSIIILVLVWRSLAKRLFFHLHFYEGIFIFTSIHSKQ